MVDWVVVKELLVLVLAKELVKEGVLLVLALALVTEGVDGSVLVLVVLVPVEVVVVVAALWRSMVCRRCWAKVGLDGVKGLTGGLGGVKKFDETDC